MNENNFQTQQPIENNQVQQPIENNNITPNNNKKKGNIVIILLTLIIIALGVCLTLLLLNKKDDKKDEPKENNNQQVEEKIDDDKDEDRSVEENEESNNNVKTSNEITEQIKVRNSIPYEEFDLMLDLTFMAHCIDKDCNGDTSLTKLNQNKVYLSTIKEQIDFANLYIRFNGDSLKDVTKGENEDGMTQYTLSKEVFNKYLNKLFGTTAKDSDFSKNAYINGSGDVEITLFPIGFGGTTWTYMYPSEATCNGNECVIPIDFVDKDAVWDDYNYKIKTHTYKKSDILTTAYLKYKKLSDGNYNIISLSFKK